MRTYKTAVAALCLSLIVLLMLTATSFGAGETDANRSRVRQAIESAIHFHQQSQNRPRRENAITEKHRLYESMVSALDLQGDFGHLQVPDSLNAEPWAVDANKISTAIRPGVNYEIVKSRGSTFICGSEETSSRLQKNIHFIRWYRGQLATGPFEGDSARLTADSTGRLIDEFLEELSDGCPAVRIRMTGDIVRDSRQKLEFSDMQIWGILASLNRHFYYKFQLNPGRSDFQEADFLLIEAMVKTAAIYGSKPPATGIQEIPFELSQRDKGWKKAAWEALDVWNDYQPTDEGICSIQIPAKPSPKKEEPKEEPADPNAFPEDVEDVKELGGKIFLKRDGRWQPWEG